MHARLFVLYTTTGLIVGAALVIATLRNEGLVSW